MQQDRLIVILADISGYTRFMIENRTSAVHGQLCINSLIEAVLAQVDIPLTLQEIEGDAVFLYARYPGSETGWTDVLGQVSEKLGAFFQAFLTQNGIRAESTPCACAICRNADKLGLKIIVHVGEAVFHDVAGRPQVSGPDVILAHRLLKNSVESNDYLLLTASAFGAMRTSLEGEYEEHTEDCEGFGPVSAHVRVLTRETLEARDAIYRMHDREAGEAVDQYLGWLRGNLARAAIQQIRSPIRGFGWKGRLLMFWEQVVLLLPRTLFMKNAIRERQRMRGSRREKWGPVDPSPSPRT